MRTRDGIERLAAALADEELWDFLYSDRWMGWPDEEDDAQLQEYRAGALPRCRERARRYAAILAGEAA